MLVTERAGSIGWAFDNFSCFRRRNYFHLFGEMGLESAHGM
jgi:hypothetical protein